jgi:mRNA interferase HigB
MGCWRSDKKNISYQFGKFTMLVTTKLPLKYFRDFLSTHGNCELQLKTWYFETEKLNWLSINDPKSEFPNASILKDNRIVFTIKGNDYRLIVKLNFEYQLASIRFIGTHAEPARPADMIKLMQTKFRMYIKPIRNEVDYQKALERLEIFFDAKIGTDDGDELEILAIVIDNYENERFPIGMPDPISAINFRMSRWV